MPLWIIGFGLAVRSPSPEVFTSSDGIKVLGFLLLATGSGIQLFAIPALRLQAARPSVDDALVQCGAYARIHHPIDAGFLLEFAGLILVEPRQTVIMAVILGGVWVLVQARLEDFDLLQRMLAYREYMSRVLRFPPKLGRKAFL